MTVPFPLLVTHTLPDASMAAVPTRERCESWKPSAVPVAWAWLAPTWVRLSGEVVLAPQAARQLAYQAPPAPSMASTNAFEMLGCGVLGAISVPVLVILVMVLTLLIVHTLPEASMEMPVGWLSEDAV